MENRHLPIGDVLWIARSRWAAEDLLQPDEHSIGGLRSPVQIQCNPAAPAYADLPPLVFASHFAMQAQLARHVCARLHAVPLVARKRHVLLL